MRLLALTAAPLAAILATVPAAAGPDRVPLPPDYATDFANYLDVDHHQRNRVRRMYVNPEALEAAAAGADLPDGTVLIMEDHDARLGADGVPVFGDDGRMIPEAAVTNIFVMRKDAAWQTENGNWDYAWYLADGSPRPEANFDGCFACHANRAERDYTFTFWKFVADRN